MSEPFHLLLALAETDEQRAQLKQSRTTLPAKVEGDAITTAAQGLMAAKTMLDEEREPLAGTLAALEAEIDGLKRRREQTTAHLSSAVGGGKELEAMDAEVKHLSASIDELETTELELLEQLSPLDDRLESLNAELETMKARHQELRTEFTQQSAALDEKVAEITKRRDELVGQIEPSLLERYERIAARTGSSGAAVLQAGHCGGCHIEMASGEIDAIHHLPLDQLGACEQCGRLLLRPEQVS